ncbi:MAG TPA: aminomethyl transferase family protein, partial [Acidimicrobiia bacterium]
MIRQTPFHSRTSAVNKTGLWSHWAGYLAADRYQMSDKFEYFAVRNSVGVFDTSPLFKYRISGDGAERYLAGVLTRDIRRCRPGQAQYTVWCDDDGWVIEDGVVLRLAEGSFLLSSARPNLAYLAALTSGLSVRVEDISDNMGVLAVQGPHSRDVLTGLIPEVATLEYFGVIATEVDAIP